MTLIDLLEKRATEQPQQIAYRFLSDGDSPEVGLTYEELDGRARAIAARLQAVGAAGERVLLVYPPGLNYIAAFFGCIYAGAVAVPIYPPRLKTSLTRIQTITADAQAKFALTTTPIFLRSRSLLASAADLKPLQWMDTDTFQKDAAGDYRRPSVAESSLAFLQYTSGSTGDPKGVMVSHGNLLHNQEMMRRMFRQSKQSIIVGWLPLYHDMGLIGTVLQPLYLGALCVLMSPASFLQRPFRWLDAISRYRATTSGGPNFAYDLCVRKITDEQKAVLDLSSWSVAFNGSETVRSETLNRFIGAFEACGFRKESFAPCYGLAEATLIVSTNRDPGPLVVKRFDASAVKRIREVEATHDSNDCRPLVGCGQTQMGQKIRLVDPQAQIGCGEGEIGEVWVSGPSVAQGYWNRPEETERTFGAWLKGTDEGPFLRTGDLGFLHDGDLYLMGRIKDLIIIRGVNYYPHDLEAVAQQSHQALSPNGSAAFSIEAENEERLVIINEVDWRKKPDPDEVFKNIFLSIAENFELQVYSIALVKPATMPKTSSGKIQRHECRKRFLAGTLDVIAQWTRTPAAPAEAQAGTRPDQLQNPEAVQTWLISRLASRLKLKESEIVESQSLSSYGADSLTAVELTHEIENEFGIGLPLADILEGLTIGELTDRITVLLQSPAQPQRRLPVSAGALSARFPLSHGQQALWFLHRLAPESAAYNLSFAARIRGDLDSHVLRNAFQRIVDRHGALRTTFSANGTGPSQQVQDHVAIFYRQESAVEWSEEALKNRLDEEAGCPFNLEQGPLLRIHLFQRSKLEHILLLTSHHIVADFWSLGVIVEELGKLYQAEREGKIIALPPFASDYNRFVQMQNEALAGNEGERLWKYWQKQLAGELPVLNWLIGKPRPPRQNFRGASVAFRISHDLTAQLASLAATHAATLYMVLLGAFQGLLYRLSGQDDIIVGTPTTGRNKADLAGQVGYFVNSVPIRAKLSTTLTFRELLEQTRRTVLDALAHQEMPFSLLADRLHADRDPSRSPLFSAMFVQQQAHLPGQAGLSTFALGEAGALIELSGLTMESISLDLQSSQFDLTMMMAEAEGGLRASVRYSTDLFDNSIIAGLIAHFQEFVRAAAADSDKPISLHSLLTEAERQQLTNEWNDTSTDYAAGQLIHELFSNQAWRTPDRVCVVFEEDQLTFYEVDRRSNQVARHLMDKGVGPDVVVGICMLRSIEMVVGLLGILKAGGAYLPLDPKLPKDRLAFMLDDARVTLVLTQHLWVEAFPETSAELISIDADRALIVCGMDAIPTIRHDPQNLAYVIYTSGSTGRPKGVMITHAGICNRLLWMQECYKLGDTDWVLQKTPFNFDVSVWEFFWPLMTGACLVMSRAGGHEDPSYLVNCVTLQGITTLHFVPSMLQTFLREPGVERCGCLRRVICSGESLSVELQNRFLSLLDCRLDNLYGPTEASVDVTSWECRIDGHLHSVPIGRPIANISSYIFDRRLNPAAIGMSGQLCLSGIGLARGYLNSPEITAEKFMPNPFSNEGGMRLYQTGDLTRYLPDGNIEFLGRIDHQVKIRGFRIEPAEVVSTLEDHPLVREAMVVSSGSESDNRRLLAYLVPTRKQNDLRGLLQKYLKEKLPAYMVPHAIVILDEMPLLPNGKINRQALPAVESLEPDGGGPYSPPRSPFEKIIVETWASILGVRRVGMHDNFFELGGNSLLAAQVISKIRATFAVDLSVRVIFEAPTPVELAEHIRIARGNSQPAPDPPLRRVRRDQPLPLSFAQERLWFLTQLNPQDPGYNVSAAVRIRGAFSLPALEQSLSQVTLRHEALRTHFEMVGGRLAQIIEKSPHLKIGMVDLSGLPESDRERQIQLLAEQGSLRPFDPARGPLLRVITFRLGDGDHALLLMMHHLVSDGWSLGVLTDELGALYEDCVRGEVSRLAPLPIQYADYAVWQREWFAGGILENQLAYWKRHLGSDLPIIQLPTDRPRPPIPTSRGAALTRDLGAAVNESLQALSRREDVTQFMNLLAVFAVLLYRYTGQGEMVVGTPVANRNRLEFEKLIGFFVNTMVLRIDLSASPSFRQLLRQIRESALGAYEHQDLPFEKLVESLQPKRDLSLTPLFQVMFTWQNPDPALTLAGSVTAPYQLLRRTAKFDLGLAMIEGNERLQAALEYRTDLFEGATIERMLGHFHTLAVAAVADPDLSISRLSLFTQEEQKQLLIEWNDTELDFPADQCVHQLFEAQVERVPDAVAAVDNNGHLAYGRLNERANKLAHFLKKAGVGPEARVGICLERSIEMTVAVLGVLKSGGSYVPLDPTYPKEHLAYLVSDSQPILLLTCERHLDKVSCPGLKTICLDNSWEKILLEDGSNPVNDACPENTAYVIYTSGSTGKHKGVMAPHRGLSNLIPACIDLFGIRPESRLAQHVSLSFDGAVWECFMALLAGATLCTGSREDLIPGRQLQRWMDKNAVTVAVLIPSFLDLLPDEGLDRLETIISGAERVSRDVAARWSTNHRFFNSYGVTETTINTTVIECNDRDHQAPSVGRPNPNTQFYVLDEHLQPAPIGIAGQGYIGGAGLARGYFNRPDLTAERFIPNPFDQGKGSRLYRTGDLLCYRSDGSLDFKGRIDYQVKLHGHRVEIAEVEEALNLCGGVGQTIVKAVDNDSGEIKLVAYLLVDPTTAPTITGLRSSLSEKLPEYLIPSAFVMMESFPLAPNGKIDRRKLPDPDQAQLKLETNYVAPQTQLEQALCSIWKRALKVENVGVESNFFDLGGHSLLLGQVHAMLAESQNIEVSLLELYQYPTIRSLAEHLRKDKSRNREANNNNGPGMRERRGSLKQRLDRSRQTKPNWRRND